MDASLDLSSALSILFDTPPPRPSAPARTDRIETPSRAPRPPSLAPAAKDVSSSGGTAPPLPLLPAPSLSSGPRSRAQIELSGVHLGHQQGARDGVPSYKSSTSGPRPRAASSELSSSGSNGLGVGIPGLDMLDVGALDSSWEEGLHGPDTSGSDWDEEEEEDMDEEDGGTTMEAGTPVPTATKSGKMPRWTAEQQHELAGLLADIKGPWAAAFREFNKRYPFRTITAIEQEHRRHRGWYERAVRRLREAQMGAVPASRSERRRASEEPEGSQPPPTKKPNPFTRRTPAQAALAPVLEEPPQPPSSSLGPEPELFRLIGISPSVVADKEGRYCFVCGSGKEGEQFVVLGSMIGTQVDPETGQKVFKPTLPRWGCSSCGLVLSQGVSGDRTCEWMEGMPEGGNEMERLAWVTEKLLVMGMKKRRDVVERVGL